MHNSNIIPNFKTLNFDTLNHVQCRSKHLFSFTKKNVCCGINVRITLQNFAPVDCSYKTKSLFLLNYSHYKGCRVYIKGNPGVSSLKQSGPRKITSWRESPVVRGPFTPPMLGQCFHYKAIPLLQTVYSAPEINNRHSFHCNLIFVLCHLIIRSLELCTIRE